MNSPVKNYQFKSDSEMEECGLMTRKKKNL